MSGLDFLKRQFQKITFQKIRKKYKKFFNRKNIAGFGMNRHDLTKCTWKTTKMKPKTFWQKSKRLRWASAGQANRARPYFFLRGLMYFKKSLEKAISFVFLHIFNHAILIIMFHLVGKVNIILAKFEKFNPFKTNF